MYCSIQTKNSKNDWRPSVVSEKNPLSAYKSKNKFKSLQLFGTHPDFIKYISKSLHTIMLNEIGNEISPCIKPTLLVKKNHNRIHSQ